MREYLGKGFIILCFAGLGACGNIGELYLPPEKKEVQQTINSSNEH